MNFSRKVKETAFLIFEKLPFREIETRMATRDPAVTRIISREVTIDPEIIKVMIRKYEQRIEWQAEAITKQENFILRLLKKVERLETKKRKPIQTEIFPDVAGMSQLIDEAFAPDTAITAEEHTAIGDITPRAEDIEINEPGKEIDGGDATVDV